MPHHVASPRQAATAVPRLPASTRQRVRECKPRTAGRRVPLYTVPRASSPPLCREAGAPIDTEDLESRTSGAPSRRAVLHLSALSALSVLGTSLIPGPAVSAAAIDEDLPLGPQVGNCIACVGEVEGTLNTCSLDSLSCVSTQNDDEAHFVPPWMYDCSREEAIEQLVSVATGGPYDPQLLQTPYGRSRSDVASYILQGTVNVIIGQPPPESKPKAQRQEASRPFDGKLLDRHSTPDGYEYLRFVFGSSTISSEPSRVIDAEFVFVPNDDIVTLRASSRVQPTGGGNIKLSFTDSPLVLDPNYSRQLLERLRKALRFEIVPVITDFDPRFNNEKQLWFEKLFDPANERYNKRRQ